MGNNWLGLKVLKWLVDLEDPEDELVGLAIHPDESSIYPEKLRETAGLSEERVFDGSRLGDDDVIDAVRSLEPDIGVSVLFGYLLRPPFLDLFENGAVNLHPAYLPYNRGAYPNVWSIVDRTPAGATLHVIDAEVDTGDILAQEEVDVRPSDTGRSLYLRLEQAGLDLFRRAWPQLKDGTLSRTTQSNDEGTKHFARDVEEIDEIDLDATYTGRELIDILRARTFPPHSGAYFEEDGRRIYLRLELTEDA